MSATIPVHARHQDLPRRVRFRDLVALTKPAIVSMTLLTATWGLMIAPAFPAWHVALGTLAGTALSVGSANAFNMWLEREGDRHMARTRKRPLPDRRLRPAVAVAFAVVTGLASVAVLALFVNPLTTLLSTLAIVVYAALYTPMKRLSSAALPVGALAGAMPPLLGWTAATESLSEPGLLLFGVLFTWQIPHFLAISLFRQEEYERAGIRIVPTRYGRRTTGALIAVSSVALLFVSAALAATDAAGTPYLVVAGIAGLAACVSAFRGLLSEYDEGWPRRYFLLTLGYLPLLAAGMVVDRLLS